MSRTLRTTNLRSRTTTQVKPTRQDVAGLGQVTTPTMSHKTLSLIRWSFWMTLLSTMVLPQPFVQSWLIGFYEWCLSCSIFHWSCFETIETIVCFAAIEHLYCVLAVVEWMEPFRFQKIRGGRDQTKQSSIVHHLKDSDRGQWYLLWHWFTSGFSQTLSKRLREVIIYTTPILLLDFTLIKKYPGASLPEISQVSGRNATMISPTFLILDFAPIQYYRTLPTSATVPTLRIFLLQLIFAIIIYDFLNGLSHYAMHQQKSIYKTLHAEHHQVHYLTHRRSEALTAAVSTSPAVYRMHPLITNHLSFFERLSFLLTANFALNLVSAHPFTRTVFIPIFMILLIDSHSGFLLPYHWSHIISLQPVKETCQHYSNIFKKINQRPHAHLYFPSSGTAIAHSTEHNESGVSTRHQSPPSTTNHDHAMIGSHPLQFFVSSYEHFQHHLTGDAYYQPFLTYGTHISK